jgi:ligand-binding sensor domain-containing protein
LTNTRDWPTATVVRALAPDLSGNLFAGTGDGVFLSTDNGTSWTAVNDGLTYTDVRALAVTGTNLFAGTRGGAFLSTNNGTSWTAVNNGLTHSNYLLDLYVIAFAVSGTNLFAGTDDGVFRSNDNGTSWTRVNNGLTNTSVRALAVSGTNLFAGTYNGVFLSTDNGTSWTRVNSGLTNLYYVNSLVVSGTNLFAGTYRGVFLSTDNGTSWTEVNFGLTNLYVLALAVSGTNLFAGTDGNGVARRPLTEMITSVERLQSDVPMQFSLSQNYPNPFNPATTISFSIPTRSFVSLKVYDAVGREVSTLVSEELAAGMYGTQWEAIGFASGTYFYRLQAGTFTETKKLILLR